MIGPDLNGLGGISRVVKIWYECGFLENYRTELISSVSDNESHKVIHLSKALLKLLICAFGDNILYIHTSSYNSFRRKIAFILIGYIFKKKVLLHIHPSHFYAYLCQLGGLEKRFIYSLLNKIHAFIVLTKDMKIKMGTLYPNHEILILPNPVDMRFLQPGEMRTRDKLRIVFLGWFIKEKGIYELADAVGEIAKTKPNIKLDFYGTKNVDSLKKYVCEKQLESNIIVHGWIGDSEKAEVLKKCTMLVLPSYSEGIPNVILEAMATKTPIVSTVVGGLSEVLEDGVNALIVRAGDSKDLEEKLSKFLDDINLRLTIAENAYSDAKTKYDAVVIKKKYQQIIDKIVHH